MINLTWKISLQETALHQGQQAQIWNLQREHCEERGGVVKLMLDKNEKNVWKVSLLRILISDVRLKYHMQIINKKYETNFFVMNPMIYISKIFATPCENQDIGKCDIKSDMKQFHQNIDGNY